MTIYPSELRIGNKLNYFVDELGYYEEITIDWQDLKWISEDIEGFNDKHKGIRLTDDILLNNGFYRAWSGRLIFDFNPEDESNYLCFSKDLKFLEIVSTGSDDIETSTIIECLYLHTLQNLIRLLTDDIVLG